MTKQEQDNYIKLILDLSPLELAEMIVMTYKDDFLRDIDKEPYKEAARKTINALQQELVELSVDYAVNKGNRMRDLINKNQY